MARKKATSVKAAKSLDYQGEGGSSFMHETTAGADAAADEILGAAETQIAQMIHGTISGAHPEHVDLKWVGSPISSNESYKSVLERLIEQVEKGQSRFKQPTKVVESLQAMRMVLDGGEGLDAETLAKALDQVKAQLQEGDPKGALQSIYKRAAKEYPAAWSDDIGRVLGGSKPSGKSVPKPVLETESTGESVGAGNVEVEGSVQPKPVGGGEPAKPPVKPRDFSGFASGAKAIAFGGEEGFQAVKRIATNRGSGKDLAHALLATPAGAIIGLPLLLSTLKGTASRVSDVVRGTEERKVALQTPTLAESLVRRQLQDAETQRQMEALLAMQGGRESVLRNARSLDQAQAAAAPRQTPGDVQFGM